MINILTEEQKKKVLTEYRFRLGVVVVFAVATLVLASLVLLAPSYFLAVSKYNSIFAELAVLESKQGRGVQEKDVNAQIISINKKIALFLKDAADAKPTPAQTILDMLNIKGSEVKIQGLTYDASGGQERFVIAGNALNRESLAQFVKTLNQEPTFTKVDLPISSYVKSANIDFSVVIERGEKKKQL
ncbi:MAG: PilN domain-containing protein [Candidatus Yonathbacteria bacterium]|nr:PilN domain-containing protein [Candidatus Yonathbacteria bacterium]